MTDELSIQQQRPSAAPYFLGGALIGGAGAAAATHYTEKGKKLVSDPAKYASWDAVVQEMNDADKFAKADAETKALYEKVSETEVRAAEHYNAEFEKFKKEYKTELPEELVNEKTAAEEAVTKANNDLEAKIKDLEKIEAEKIKAEAAKAESTNPATRKIKGEKSNALGKHNTAQKELNKGLDSLVARTLKDSSLDVNTEIESLVSETLGEKYMTDEAKKAESYVQKKNALIEACKKDFDLRQTAKEYSTATQKDLKPAIEKAKIGLEDAKTEFIEARQGKKLLDDSKKASEFLTRMEEYTKKSITGKEMSVPEFVKQLSEAERKEFQRIFGDNITKKNDINKIFESLNSQVAEKGNAEGIQETFEKAGKNLKTAEGRLKKATEALENQAKRKPTRINVPKVEIPKSPELLALEEKAKNAGVQIETLTEEQINVKAAERVKANAEAFANETRVLNDAKEGLKAVEEKVAQHKPDEAKLKELFHSTKGSEAEIKKGIIDQAKNDLKVWFEGSKNNKKLWAIIGTAAAAAGIVGLAFRPSAKES